MSDAATILAIERCSLHDGPGIRTTVFFKGCPLRCLWCHNPESQSFAPQLFYVDEKCAGCRACESACPQQCHSLAGAGHSIARGRCDACGRCAAACPHQALEVKGRPMSVAEVMAEVAKDEAFYAASGGGMTLSGGEPLAQFDFAAALLAAARERGIHTCVETCGMVGGEELRRLAPRVDLFLYDWKASDEQLHRRLTGASNRQVADNLQLLCELGSRIILRCPLVPGVNDDDGHLAGIARLARDNAAIERVEIMPFHAMGAGKAGRIGEVSPLRGKPDATEADKGRWLETLRSLGCDCASIS